jgi:hypothetical protein
MENTTIKDNAIGYLTMKNTCQTLQCSPTFIYGLVKEKVLTPKYLGTRPYFSVDEIKAAFNNEKK